MGRRTSLGVFLLTITITSTAAFQRNHVPFQNVPSSLFASSTPEDRLEEIKAKLTELSSMDREKLQSQLEQNASNPWFHKNLSKESGLEFVEELFETALASTLDASSQVTRNNAMQAESAKRRLYEMKEKWTSLGTEEKSLIQQKISAKEDPWFHRNLSKESGMNFLEQLFESSLDCAENDDDCET